jgi:hypothetical protein
MGLFAAGSHGQGRTSDVRILNQPNPLCKETTRDDKRMCSGQQVAGSWI